MLVGSFPASFTIPDAIDDAPKMTKQPKMICAPRRMSIRPEQSRNPTDATAITATAGRDRPSNVP